MQRAAVFNVVVQGIEALSEAVRRVVLGPQTGTPHMRYREGQFLSALLPDGDSRCYSMASPCRGDGVLELHVRLQSGGKFSALLAGGLKPGDAMEVSGPFGDCILRPAAEPRQQMVMLATGTGAAPIKAMIERMFIDGEDRPVSFYWGGYTSADLYLSDHFDNLQELCPNFRFVPLLAAPDDQWPGRRGFVQDAAAEDFRDLGAAVVYACGAPAMVGAARRLLTEQRALPPENFHADPFAPSVAGLPAAAGTGGVVRIQAAASNGVLTEVAGGIGATLLETLKGAGLPIHGICGGKKACGACRVRMDPPTPSDDRDELRLLAALDASHPGDRLSCQVRLHAGHDGVSVRLPASPF